VEEKVCRDGDSRTSQAQAVGRWNRKLKRLVVNLSFDKAMPQDVLSKKV
jgi:hypothetical protein